MRVTAGGWQTGSDRMYQQILFTEPAAVSQEPEKGNAASEPKKEASERVDYKASEAGQAVLKDSRTAFGTKITEASGKDSEPKTEFGSGKAAKTETDIVELHSSRDSEEDDILLKRLQEMMDPQKNSNQNSKVRSSMPDDSVGELAAMLARAETRIDVQQVASKAVRALTNLKMALAASEGSEAKKIAAMIKRMEKLMKRIQKKLQHLSKEEQIERRSIQAEKKNELKKAEELRKELQSRRKKRRRDERNYAAKELYEDAKAEANDMAASIAGAIQASGAVSAAEAVGGLSAGGADFAGGDFSAGAVSIDVTV